MGGALDVTGAVTGAGAVSITDTTATSDVDTGSIVTDGGVGIALGVTVGGDVVVTSTTTTTSATTGSVKTAGGLGVAENAFVGGTGTITGAATLSDTLGVTGAATLSSTLSVTDAVDTSSTMTVAGVTTVQDATDATDESTAALVVTGGAGIGKNTYIGGILSVTDTTQATGAYAASLMTAGGLGVAMDANISGTVYAGGMSFSSVTLDAGTALTITQDTTNIITVETTGALTLASATAQDIDVASAGNVDISSASTYYSKMAAASGNYLKVYDSGIDVVTQTGSPLNITSGGDVTLATSSTTADMTIDAGQDLTINFGGVTDTGAMNIYSGTDAIFSTDYASGSLTISTATTSTTGGAVLTLTGSHTVSTTTGVRISADDESSMDLQGYGIDIYACDCTGGTCTTTCGDATLKGSGATLQAVSTSGVVNIKALDSGTVNMVADSAVNIEAQGTTTTTAAMTLTAGGYLPGTFALQQPYYYSTFSTQVSGSPAADRFAIDTNGAITFTTLSASNVEFGTNYIETTGYTQVYNAGQVNLRTNYHHKLWNYFTTISDTAYTTVATVTLEQYASVLVELVLEGEWSSAPSLYRGVYIITHNDGNTPEASASDTNYLIREDQIIAASGQSWSIQIVPSGTATATKPFAISVQASDTGITSVNVQCTVTGRINALA
uniref:Uncharacterized protein n=1 Tax=Pyramimonas obovata TaxID=1411642 RepID=A0A7S0QW77_9CHLO